MCYPESTADTFTALMQHLNKWQHSSIVMMEGGKRSCSCFLEPSAGQAICNLEISSRRTCALDDLWPGSGTPSWACHSTSMFKKKLQVAHAWQYCLRLGSRPATLPCSMILPFACMDIIFSRWAHKDVPQNLPRKWSKKAVASEIAKASAAMVL